MKIGRTSMMVAVAAILASSCSGITLDAEPESTTTQGEVAPSVTPSTTLAPTTTATTQPPLRDIDVSLEPPPFEEVSVTTDDGVTLGARLWRGSDIAVVVAHDFDNLSTPSSGQRAPRSGEQLLWLSGTLAREGYTVLSPDFRGHGLSGGELDKNTGSVDMKAAYEWLVDEGANDVVVVGWVGAGTVAVVLDQEDEAVDFSGIAMMFSPPQEAGHNAQAVIGDLATPTINFGINPGTSPRFAKLLSDAAGASLGYHNYDAVPTGLTFVDVHGVDIMSRLLDFIEAVAP